MGILGKKQAAAASAPRPSLDRMARAVGGADHASLTVVGVAWAAAVVFAFLAWGAVENMRGVRTSVANTRASTPVVPAVTFAPATAADLAPVIARAKKAFPDLMFRNDESGAPSVLTVIAEQPDLFRAWLGALSYVENVDPGLRWNIDKMCLGLDCATGGRLQAELKAQKLQITVPR